MFRDLPEILSDEAAYGEPPEKVQDLWSVPGRAEIAPNGNVLILLEKDEVFRRFKNHQLVFGYTMSGDVESLWTPPFVEAKAPVGSEWLKLEVFFPPGWDLARDTRGAPARPQLYLRESDDTLSELPRGLSEIETPPHYDFKDGRGPIQWFRAVIRKPPDGGNKKIVLKWQWEQVKPKPLPDGAPLRAVE
jgi:hypothetical protein